MKIADLIIFENDDFIVLNKPAGLLSIPDREGIEISLKKILQDKFGKIFTVHRLDKDTSGAILFAKNEIAHVHFSKQFEERRTIKIYRGLVIGSPAEPSGRIDLPIMEHPVKKGTMVVHHKGKEAITEYELLENFGIYSWMQFSILTGRTHQIRVHMQQLGHPIACDEVYGDGKPVLVSSLKRKNFKLAKKEEEERPILSRLGLHSLRLTIQDIAGNQHEIEAPVPKDLRATLQQLEKRVGIKR